MIAKPKPGTTPARKTPHRTTSHWYSPVGERIVDWLLFPIRAAILIYVDRTAGGWP